MTVGVLEVAFLLEAVAAIDRIRRFPHAWQPLGESTRRCRLQRFPYVAVAHSHRRPDYWRERVKAP